MITRSITINIETSKRYFERPKISILRLILDIAVVRRTIENIDIKNSAAFNGLEILFTPSLFVAIFVKEIIAMLITHIANISKNPRLA